MLIRSILQYNLVKRLLTFLAGINNRLWDRPIGYRSNRNTLLGMGMNENRLHMANVVRVMLCTSNLAVHASSCDACHVSVLLNDKEDTITKDVHAQIVVRLSQVHVSEMIKKNAAELWRHRKHNFLSSVNSYAKLLRIKNDKRSMRKIDATQLTDVYVLNKTIKESQTTPRVAQNGNLCGGFMWHRGGRRAI